MTTCSDIIARAFRMRKIVAVGDEAQADEADEAMIVLQSIYARLADTAMAPAAELYETDDYEAEEGDRVYCLGTVTLPDTVIDGFTGDERRPADLAAVQYNESGDGWQTWLSDRGDWVRVDDLEEGDEAPLADRNREGLSALLAMELSTFGGELTPEIQAKARRFQSQMQPKDTSPNEYF